MKRTLITLGFPRMMLPPTKPLAPEDVTAATMERLREDAKRWREYDFPAYKRFISSRSKRAALTAIHAAQPDSLPGILRRQAE